MRVFQEPYSLVLLIYRDLLLKYSLCSISTEAFTPVSQRGFPLSGHNHLRFVIVRVVPRYVDTTFPLIGR